MCLILDANLASMVFPKEGKAAGSGFVPLLEWLFGREGRLVYGGRNARELEGVSSAAQAILELRRSGRALHIRGVDKEEKSVKARLGFRSDDPHILALARISGARTLCSHDIALHSDFKNQELVPHPKGMIYQNASHAHTLKHTAGCQGPP